jgi:N6-adenosine-specific RNA methylase IME4
MSALPDIPAHPLAEIFPLMGEADRAALEDSMRATGFDPDELIVLYEGKILDGRNRYALARELGLSPDAVRVREFGEIESDWADPSRTALDDGSGKRALDPLAFVLRKNLARRHLTESQRAMVAGRLATMRSGARTDLAPIGARSDAEAAAELNVGERSVERAKTVQRQGVAELGTSVDRGEISVSAAAEIAALPESEQREIVARGEKEILKKAKEIRQQKQEKKHVERQQKCEETSKNNPGLPGRLHSLALVDVPRKHNVYDDTTGSEKAPDNHYPTMSFRELIDFPIDRFLARDAIIVFWSTAASLVDDLEILAEWGFVALRPRDENGRLVRDEAGEPVAALGGGKYGSEQVWHKERPGAATGTGRWFLDMHEKLIVARRGDAPAPLPGTQDVSCFAAPWDGHSVKPHARVRAWIDRCWPHMDKIELFARVKPGEPQPMAGASRGSMRADPAGTEPVLGLAEGETRGLDAGSAELDDAPASPPPGWTFWGNQAPEQAAQSAAVSERREEESAPEQAARSAAGSAAVSERRKEESAEAVENKDAAAREMPRPLVDAAGLIRRGHQRVSLRRLSETGFVSWDRCSMEMLNNYTELSQLTPALCVFCDDGVAIAPAGCKALSGWQVGDRPVARGEGEGADDPAPARAPHPDPLTPKSDLSDFGQSNTGRTRASPSLVASGERENGAAPSPMVMLLGIAPEAGRRAVRHDEKCIGCVPEPVPFNRKMRRIAESNARRGRGTAAGAAA